MRAIRTASALLIPLAVMACAEQGGGDQASMDGGDAGADQGAQDAATRQAGTNVALGSKNNTGITGTARMTPRGDSVAVQVRLSGLTEGESYAAHVHEGTCESGGGVAVGLNAVTGQADGTGSSTKTIASLPSGQSYFVQAHLPDGTPAACGDVPGMEGASADTASGGEM